jgi:hypothetical protein
MGMKLAATVLVLAVVLVTESGCGSPTCHATSGRFACDPTAPPTGSEQEEQEVPAQVEPAPAPTLERAPPPPFWRDRPKDERVP